ncbi:MAG: hypothetical protein GXO10_03155 [Crenarchaeota archaeon]|nr:hypothetical protein [Thermoproteota archaeon]
MPTSNGALKDCEGPKCPEFRCLKRCLKIVRRGKDVQVICTLTNDVCIGAKCQFASCMARALTPDGKCLKSRREEGERSPEMDIVREARKLEKDVEKVRSKLKKIGLEDYL